MPHDSTSSVAERPLETAIANAPALRLVRPKRRPTLSVVLAIREFRSDLGDSLRGLALMCAQADAEMIIVGADPRDVLGRTPSDHVRHLLATADAPISTMRERAMRRCTGDIVVLLDCAVHPHHTWASRVRASLRRVGAWGTEKHMAPQFSVEWSDHSSSAGAP